MDLSIIIPVYNADKYVKKCLESILSHNITDYEIILINDGSNDKSFDILHEFEMKYDFIKVLNQINSGQGIARNRALQIAKGEYITFIDADDFLRNNSGFNDLYIKCKEYNLDILIYNYNVVVKNNIINEELNFDDSRIFNREEIIQKFLCTNEVEGFACNKFFKKELLHKNKISFLEDRKYEDIPMVVKSILSSNRIMFDNHKIYNYVIHKNSTTNKINSKTLLDEVYSMNLTAKLIKDSNLKSNVKKEIDFYIKYKIELYTKCRVKNLLKNKLEYREFKNIIKEYIKLYNEYSKTKKNMLLKILEFIY